MNTRLAFSLLSLLLLVTPAYPRDIIEVLKHARNRSVTVNFDKSSVAFGAWEGTVSGDITGTVRTELKEFRVSGDLWRVEFDFIISAGDASFKTRLRGVLNPQTGKVFMDGRVTEGFREGAQVQEEAQLVDAASLRFQGRVLILGTN